MLQKVCDSHPLATGDSNDSRPSLLPRRTDTSYRLSIRHQCCDKQASLQPRQEVGDIEKEFVDAHPTKRSRNPSYVSVLCSQRPQYSPSSSCAAHHPVRSRLRSKDELSAGEATLCPDETRRSRKSRGLKTAGHWRLYHRAFSAVLDVSLLCSMGRLGLTRWQNLPGTFDVTLNPNFDLETLEREQMKRVLPANTSIPLQARSVKKEDVTAAQ